MSVYSVTGELHRDGLGRPRRELERRTLSGLRYVYCFAESRFTQCLFLARTFVLWIEAVERQCDDDVMVMSWNKCRDLSV